jgi:type IV fimbrial biogenesis protein FimT
MKHDRSITQREKLGSSIIPAKPPLFIRNDRGFTLIELLVTIAIVAILTTLAAPSFRDMLLNNRLTAQAGGLTTILNYARNSALSQAITVRVCPLAVAGSANCGNNWAAGWIVVSDPSGTPTLIQTKQLAPSGPVLTSTAAIVDFDPRGLTTTASTFKVCDQRGANYARSVQVFATGFIQSGITPGKQAWGNGSLVCP